MISHIPHFKFYQQSNLLYLKMQTGTQMVAHKIRRIQKRLTVTVGWVGFLPTTYATKIDL